MPIVLIQCHERIPEELRSPTSCPSCGATEIRRWGAEKRGILDTQPIEATIIRYRCTKCGRTFRHYPKGVDRSPVSDRIRRLAALIWLMDMSIRDVVDVFEDLGISLNRMTVWREGQKLVSSLSKHPLLQPERRLSLIREGNGNQSKHSGILLALSLSNEKICPLGLIDAPDALTVVQWLQTLLQDFDIKVSLRETREVLA